MSHDHERRIADLTTRRNWLAGRIRAEEQRRREIEDAKHRRHAQLQREEDYLDDIHRAEGLLARYHVYDPERRAVIEANVARLFADRPGDPPPVSYAAAPFDARVVTLAAFLGIARHHPASPRLVLDGADIAADRYTYRHTGGPADLAEWRRQLSTIRGYLDPDADWTVTLRDPLHVVLTRHRPLPRQLPLNPAWLVPGQVFLGLDPITRQPLAVPLSEWTHMLVCGASGFGKSNAVHIMLTSLFTSLDQISAIYLVDGKDGVGLARYRHRDPKVQVLWETETFATLLDRLNTLLTERNAAQLAAGIDNATSDFVIVLIDELAAFLTPPHGADKAQKIAHKQMLDRLIALARRGRSVGIRLVCTVQEPTEESLPVAVRNNLTTVIAFALPIAQHATAVFGDLAGLPADPRTLPVGRAIYWNRASGRQSLVQVPLNGLISTDRNR